MTLIEWWSCLGCGHPLEADWCHWCETDELVISNIEIKDRSR